MITSWDKLVQNVDTKYGQGISNDMNNKIKVNIIIPVHSTEVLVRRATREVLVRTIQYNIQVDFQEQACILRAVATADPSDAELRTKIAIMDNGISKGDYDTANVIPI